MKKKPVANRFRIKRKVYYILGSIVLFALISFVEKKQADREIKAINVHIDYEYDNYFVTEEKVLDLISKNGSDRIIGASYNDIDLKTLELRIKSHKFVEEAQVYKDLKGNLTVEVSQCRPVARVVQSDGPHAYIGSSGNTLSTSDEFTARVLLIDGSGSAKLTKKEFFESEEGKPYLDLINFLDQDKFWKAQIAQLTVERNGDISMYTQIGDQLILFGKPEEVESKFKRLKIFYKEILPTKGWNSYNKVNLKFKDQIICE
ncbi:cell division protein FtsQ/DivIB [Sporocytophaga myxococcoides]|uniref:cell division protein FtsQ/DivIB n=1 Tax=Sporocytophaga myxococcoides TaxID=153721 RepID=UPI0005ED5495|nr:hypothetical protein [Sporocytophaga myxococcoides]